MEDDTTVNLREIGCGDKNWIDFTQNRVEAFVNMLMNFQSM
jgi:hypothetical protein